MNSTSKSDQIDLALSDLKAQDKPNIRGTAKRFNVTESTLRRRFNGQTVSRKAADSMYRQLLTSTQEEVLIQQINRLTDRGMPPTSSIVKNLVEEMLGTPIGKNWTGDFVKRYSKRLTSCYLRPIDANRVKAEYAPVFNHYFDLVISCYFSLVPVQ